MKPECANAANHTPMPDGYLERHEWARQMLRTHKQTRCPQCSLWVVWVPQCAGAKPIPPESVRCGCFNCMMEKTNA
jgi:hypothetical protein